MHALAAHHDRHVGVVVGAVAGEVHPEVVLGGLLQVGVVGIAVSPPWASPPSCAVETASSRRNPSDEASTGDEIRRLGCRPWLTRPSATSSTASSSAPRRGRPTTSSTRARARSTRRRRSRRRGRRPRVRRRRGGLRVLGRHHAPGARARRCSGSPTPSTPAPTRSCGSRSRDTGKPVGLTASEELPPSSDHFRFFAGAARVLEGTSAGEYLADHTSFVRREPVGVVGQVTPWNYPLMMMIWKIAPALAAGNTVVLKPSDTTPASSTLLAEICQEFLPPGVLNVVCGDRDTGRLLVEHRDPADGLDHRLGARRHGGRRRPPPPTSSGSTSSWAARRRWWSSTTPTSPAPPGRSPRRGSSTPGRTAPPPAGSWSARASTTSSSPR